MNKKILSILLAALLLLGMTTGAVAEKHQHTYVAGLCTDPTCGACDGTHSDGDGWVKLTDLTNSTTSINSSGKYYLDGDVELSETLEISKHSSGNAPVVTLCLHGQKLKGNANAFVIQISYGATLNLTDCNTSVVRYGKWNSDQFVISDAYDNGGIELKGGVITGGYRGVHISKGTLNMYKGNIAGNKINTTSTQFLDRSGGGVFVGNNSMFNMYGGSITGNKADYSGGVYTYDDSTFNMYDGSIAKNKAESGGGVYNDSYFTMSGGSITGNTVINRGGGIYNSGNFTMSGESIIAQNTALDGGGIYNSASKIDMTGGSITENTANDKGGGVYTSHYNDSTHFKMTGGNIIKNTATTKGGGVYVYNIDNTNYFAPFKLEGNPVIKENTKGTNTPSNVYLDRKSNGSYGLPLIIITNALTNTTPIGVEIYNNTGKFTRGSADYASKFVSDNTNYKVKVNTVNANLELEDRESFGLTSEPPTDGTFTVNQGTLCREGTTVTVKTNPADGKTVKAVIVTDKNGQSVPVTRVKTNEYTFVMPASEAKVEVMFGDPDKLSITAGGTTQYFESLEEAFDYAATNNLSDFVIKVEKSYEEQQNHLSINFSGRFTLDLNGKKISFNGGIEGTGIGYICFAEESTCTPTLQDSVGGGKLNAMLNLEDTDSPIITGGTYRSILASAHVTISGGTFVGLEDGAVKKLTDSSEYSYKNFAQKCGTLGLAMVSDGNGFNSKEAALRNFSHRLSEGYTTDKPVEIKKIVNDAGSFEYIPGFAAGTTVIKIVPPAQTAQPQTGDNSSMALWLALGALSLAGVLFLKKRSRSV